MSARHGSHGDEHACPQQGDDAHPFLRYVSAIYVLQRFVHARNIEEGTRSIVNRSYNVSKPAEKLGNAFYVSGNTVAGSAGQYNHPVSDNTNLASDQPNYRLRLIQSFISFYERKYRYPVVNITSAERNDAFRDFCGRLILTRYRQYRKRLRYYYRTHYVYAQAALLIYRRFLDSPVSKNDYIKVVKARKLQQFIIRRRMQRQFGALKHNLAKIADPQQTDPLEVLKRISAADHYLLCSLQQKFTLRFRLGGKYPQWPPRIYWKVFLACNISDIADTAPRNYAIEALTGEEHKELWYIRVTNAQWRELNGRALQGEYISVLKPFMTRYQKIDLRNQRAIYWKKQLRENYLLEEIDANFNFDDGKELEKWSQQLDYMYYTENWLDFCSSKFSFIEEEIIEMSPQAPKVIARTSIIEENEENTGFRVDLDESMYEKM